VVEELQVAMVHLEVLVEPEVEGEEVEEVLRLLEV
jgi:hypothetical protein